MSMTAKKYGIPRMRHCHAEESPTTVLRAGSHFALAKVCCAGARSRRAGATMIAIPGNLRVWMATGHTDVRRGFLSLALMVQEELKPRSSLMSRARLCS
jgi:hypothetical protein